MTPEHDDRANEGLWLIDPNGKRLWYTFNNLLAHIEAQAKQIEQLSAECMRFDREATNALMRVDELQADKK